MSKSGKASSFFENRFVKAVVGLLIIISMVALIYVEHALGSRFWSDIAKRLKISSGVIEESGKLYVHYLDVGQADCTVIRCNGKTALIDAGDVDSFSAISRYLDSLGVKDIDYFIITHMHTDHIGSASDIIKKYDVKNVITVKLDEKLIPTNDVYGELLNTLASSKTEVLEARTGDKYSLSDAEIVILGPIGNYDELNDMSVITRVDFGSSRFLFTGDAQSAAELDLVNSGADIAANVLKVGHHGSITSTRGLFLNAVNPEIAVISCGKMNAYGHPDAEVILKLTDIGADIYRTDENGDVVVFSDGKELFVNTEE